VLTQLNIQGLAIIDSLSIDFSHGFNVITGETGAGKSILIKALGLLLGAKASAETVRRGREAASVSGLFEAPIGHRCSEVLDRYGIPAEPAAGSFTILVRRTVNNKGRSLAWINDVPVTIAVLKELACSLIDVFGQHENLRLLDPVQHMNYVDQFLKDKSLVRRYGAEYAACQEALYELTAMVDDFRTKRRDADYLAYRCDELRKFAPAKEDFDNVQGLCQRGSHLLTLVTGLEQVQGSLDQGAEGEALSRTFWEVSRVLARLEAVSPALKQLADDAGEIASRIDDLSFSVGKELSRTEIDEGDLEAAQERLAGYQELFRKLAVPDVDGLLAERDRLESELGFLESAAVEVASRLESLGARAATLTAEAAKLSKARRKAKDAVKARIEAELQELAMPGAVIDVEFTTHVRSLPALDVALFGEGAQVLWARAAEQLAGLGEQGAEKAQFLLAANPGESMLPLQKIASGGEISRVMLALKKALAAGADTCILVFDEIDTGISGRVADVVGRKMQELATSFQVICISHLAQVAAYADAHFLVHKFGRDQRTESTITCLAKAQSEAEIARLLSGAEVTPSSLENARALIVKARAKASRAAGTGREPRNVAATP